MDERLLVAEIFLWHFGRKLTFWSPMSTYLFHFESFLMEGIKGRYTSSWCLISGSGPDGAPRKYEAWNKVFCWLEGSRPHRSADETVSLAVIVTENTDLVSTLSFIQLLSFSFTRFSIHGAPYTWKALPHPSATPIFPYPDIPLLQTTIQTPNVIGLNVIGFFKLVIISLSFLHSWNALWLCQDTGLFSLSTWWHRLLCSTTRTISSVSSIEAA